MLSILDLQWKIKHYFGYKHRGLISLCTSDDDLKPFKWKFLKYFSFWVSRPDHHRENFDSFLSRPKLEGLETHSSYPWCPTAFCAWLKRVRCFPLCGLSVSFLVTGEQSSAQCSLSQGWLCCFQSIFQLVTFLIMKSKENICCHCPVQPWYLLLQLHCFHFFPLLPPPAFL